MYIDFEKLFTIEELARIEEIDKYGYVHGTVYDPLVIKNFNEKYNGSITYKNITYSSISELAKAYGCRPETLTRKLKEGYTIDRAIKTISANKDKLGKVRIKHNK